jgi:hypothetical protein
MKLSIVSVNGPREPYLLDEPRINSQTYNKLDYKTYRQGEFINSVSLQENHRTLWSARNEPDFLGFIVASLHLSYTSGLDVSLAYSSFSALVYLLFKL